jgi:hypothetical protein
LREMIGHLRKNHPGYPREAPISREIHDSLQNWWGSQSPDFGDYSMLSMAQEYTVCVTLGPDLLTESRVDRSAQISHEEFGDFYNIVESNKIHHFSPC